MFLNKALSAWFTRFRSGLEAYLSASLLTSFFNIFCRNERIWPKDKTFRSNRLTNATRTNASFTAIFSKTGFVPALFLRGFLADNC